MRELTSIAANERCLRGETQLLMDCTQARAAFEGHLEQRDEITFAETKDTLLPSFTHCVADILVLGTKLRAACTHSAFPHPYLWYLFDLPSLRSDSNNIARVSS